MKCQASKDFVIIIITTRASFFYYFYNLIWTKLSAFFIWWNKCKSAINTDIQSEPHVSVCRAMDKGIKQWVLETQGLESHASNDIYFNQVICLMF